jgi:hypothetical protein
MKKLAIITIFGYIALAIFGFTGMHEHSSFNACLRTAFPTSMPCAGSSTNDIASAQAGIYHAFSTAGDFALALLLALVAFAVLALKLSAGARAETNFIRFSDSHQETPSYRKLTDWFTVFQKRDPSII